MLTFACVVGSTATGWLDPSDNGFGDALAFATMICWFAVFPLSTSGTAWLSARAGRSRLARLNLGLALAWLAALPLICLSGTSPPRP